MSHSAKVSTKLACSEEATLVTCLEELYGMGSVEVHEEPAQMLSYSGTTRPGVKAHVIVRHNKLSGAFGGRNPLSNDLGFTRGEDGFYAMDVDRSGLTEEMERKLKGSFAEKVLSSKGAMAGYAVTKTQLPDGRLKLSWSK